MSQPNETNTENTWFFFRIITWIWTKSNRLFAQNIIDYPADEAGELMKRNMAQMSWFDKISADWYRQSIIIKSAYIVGFTLVAGFIGFFTGTALFLELSVLIIGAVSHKLLVSHEQKRQERARVTAQESIALRETLMRQKVFFREAAQKLSDSAATLKDQVVRVEVQTEALDSGIPALHQAENDLQIAINEVKKDTALLAEKEKEASTILQAVSQDLIKLDPVVSESMAQVERVGDAAAQFSDVVQEMKLSQKRFSEAVNQFSLFSHRQEKDHSEEVETVDVDPANIEIDFDSTETAADLAQHEAFIEYWQQKYGISA